MAMKRCPICGERYSDTYKECPFCEEEAAFQEGEKLRRANRGGRRSAGKQSVNLITPTLVVLILIMAGLLVYLLWGDKIAEKFRGEEPPPIGDVTPGQTGGPADGDPAGPTDPVDPAGPDDQEPGGTMPEDTPPETDTPTGGGTDYETTAKLPDGLTLSTTDFTLKNLGESHTITVSGGSGSYTWISEDDGIASVDSSGKVIAVSGGTARVLVTDGSKKGVCIVRVSASGSLPTAPAVTGGDSGSGGAHTLNREDMTLHVGEKFQLKLTGVTTALTWSSSNASVATVDGSGNVTAVAPGNATVTVSWDGASMSCIVRVK